MTQVAGTDIDVSLITINYNSAAETIELLKSLKAHRPRGLHVEVLVVDNASRPDDFAQLESYLTTEAGSPVAGDKAPGFAMRLLRSQINLGFSGGNMYGAYAAGGKYLLFLNNDCLVASDIFSPFVDFMQNHQPPAQIAMLDGADPHEGYLTPRYFYNERPYWPSTLSQSWSSINSNGELEKLPEEKR